MADTNRKTTLSFEAENNTKAKLNEIKKDVREVGEEVAKAATKAGDSFDGMTKSGQEAAGKLDRSTQSIIRSMEREVAAMQAGGKSTAAYYEEIAKQRGADMTALGPYLQQMRLAEKQAAESLKTMGNSAKQTAAALRGVPAQFTDIAVSLQGGQAPLTVFLQQGGQLKDMFGGAGNAAKALGGYVLSLVTPYTVAAAAVVALGAAMASAESTLRTNMQLMSQLEATGRAGYLNSDAIKQLKIDMAELPGVSKSMATAIIADLVQVRTLGGEALEKIAMLSADFAAATGQDAAGAAKELAKAMEDPAKGARTLDEAFNFLTASQLITVDAMVEAGDKAGAQAVVLDALKDHVEGLAKDGLTPLQEASKNFGDAWDGAMGQVGNRGPLDTANELMAGLVNRTAELVKWLGRARLPDWMEQHFKGGLNGMVYGAIVGGGASTPSVVNKGGATGSWAPSTGGASGSWGASSANALDTEVKAIYESTKGYKAKATAIDEVRQKAGSLKATLMKLREEGRGGSAEAKQLEANLAGVNERLASLTKVSKGAGAAERARVKDLSDQAKTLAQLSGLTATFSKDWDNLNKVYAKGGMSLEALEQAQANLLAKQPFAIALAREEEALQKSRIKLYEKEAGEREKQLKLRQNAAQQVEDTLRKAQEEEQAYALAAMAGITLAEAVAQIAIQRAEDNYQKAIGVGADGDTLLALQREIEARHELSTVMQQRGVREANKKAAEEAAKDWDKTAQTISRSLTDYIMSGGQDAAQYLKRLFANLVLEPVIQTGVGVMASAMGSGSGSSSFSGGIGGTVNAYKTLTSSSGMFSDFGGYLSNTAYEAGGSLYSSGLDSLGQNAYELGDALAGYADAINIAGDVIGYGKALYDLSQGKYGSAVGTAIGTYFGGPIGAAIGSAIGGWVDSATASRGANHSGAAYSTAGIGNNAAAAQIFGSTSGDWYGDVTERHNRGVEGQLAVSMSVLAGVYNSLTSFAGEAARQIDVLGAFVANGVHQDEDAYGYGQIRDKQSGEILGAFTNRELGTDRDAAWATYVGQMGGLIVEQLKASDIPGWMKQQLNTLGDDVTVEGLDAVLKQIATIDMGFKVLGQSMGMFNGMSAQTQTALLNISGGLEGLNTNAGTYYQGFYDEAERMDILSGNLRTAMGGLDLSIDPAMGNEAKEQYRQAVEDAFAAGNGEVAAKLLALSGNFASAADYAQKAAEESSQAIIQAAQESAQAAQELADNLRSSLIGLEGRFSGGGLSSQYQSQDAAGVLQGLFASIGISKSADELSQIILGATPTEIEQNFRNMWGMLGSDEARQKLVDVTGAMLDMAGAADSAADASNALFNAIAAYRESLAGVIESAQLQTMTGQGRVDYLTGKESGLWAQLNTADDPVAVAQKLQQTIIDRINAEADLRFKVDEITLQGLQSQLGVAEALKSAISSMQSARDSLTLGNDSPLNPYAQMQYAGGKFDDAYARALAGDMDAWKDVQSFGQSYVSLGRDNYASSAGSVDIYDRVTAAMDQLIGLGLDVDPEIAALNTQIELQQTTRDNTEQSVWIGRQQVDVLTRLDGVMQAQQSKAQEQGAQTIELLKEQNAKLQQNVEQQKAQMTQQSAMAAQSKEEMQLLRDEIADLKATVRGQAKAVTA